MNSDISNLKSANLKIHKSQNEAIKAEKFE
jgi:hypothetical protein